MHPDKGQTLTRPGFRDLRGDFIQTTTHPGRVEELAFGRGGVRHKLEMNAARRGVNAKVSGRPFSQLISSSLGVWPGSVSGARWMQGGTGHPG
jgi:hypothetical protein